MNRCQFFNKMVMEHCNGFPNDYQQVEYLQSSGTQYINTGVEGWTDLVVKLDQEVVSWSGSEFDFFGSDNITSYNYAGVFNSFSNFIFQLGSPYIQYGAKDDARHVHTFDAVNKTAYTDNNTPVSGSSLSWYTISQCSGKPFRLFLRFPNSNVGSLKMYGATFTRLGARIRNFVPCYRKYDNKPGMYDLVSSTFYTNAGTGEFTVGPAV